MIGGSVNGGISDVKMTEYSQLWKLSGGYMGVCYNVGKICISLNYSIIKVKRLVNTDTHTHTHTHSQTPNKNTTYYCMRNYQNQKDANPKGLLNTLNYLSKLSLKLSEIH